MAIGQLCKASVFSIIKLVSASANVIVTAYMYSTKQECSQPLFYIIVIALK